MTSLLGKQALYDSIAAWLAEGKRVAGPVRIKPGLIHYAWLDDPAALVLDGYVRPSNSIKAFLFPPHEALFSFQRQGRRVELQSVPAEGPEQVIVAARPCDAGALPILDCVFNWDSPDAFYNSRRRRTTILTLACRTYDEYCFCTSMGGAPDDTRGSDALLLPVKGGHFEVRLLSEKGRRVLAAQLADSDRVGQSSGGPATRFQFKDLEQFLDSRFDDPFWKQASLRCIGCGSCAHNCPACHCFDIVDEARGHSGCRVRNWDSCQSAVYSLHASGHNPRMDQAARQRNRLLHKYRVYPEKFSEILCTGCGACTRNCPVQLGVAGMLEQLADYHDTTIKETVS
jgi:ferredoxin